MTAEDKYKIVIKNYIKQRIIIRMKYLNQHMLSLREKRKAKSQLQKLSKLRKVMT